MKDPQPPLHFQSFFPQYAPTFQKFLAGPCQDPLLAYLHQDTLPNNCDYTGCLSGRVVHCLLSQATESTKANMAAAAVLLGLLPTTLSLIGSNTVETGVLALRRPVLAGLLAAGTPAVAPMRLFDYDDPVELVSKRTAGMAGEGLRVFGGSMVGFERKRGVMMGLVVVMEYLVAAAAVANLAHLSYLLSVQAVCSFSSETAFHPALWASLALMLHVWGAVTVRMRVGLRESGEVLAGEGEHPSRLGAGRDARGLDGRRAKPGVGAWRRMLGLFAREFQTSFYRPLGADGLQLEVQDKSSLFVFCTWVTSIATVSHIIYGTLIFSSILFISTSDAVQVVARFVGSTVICRIILVFEIAGMQQRIGSVVEDFGNHASVKGECQFGVSAVGARRTITCIP